jgi:hypothetical protein
MNRSIYSENFMKSNKNLIIIIIVAVFVLLFCCCAAILAIILLTPNNPVTETLKRNISFTDTFDNADYGWSVGTTSNDLGTITRDISNGKYSWTMENKTEQMQVALANPTVERSKSVNVSVDADQVSGDAAVNYILMTYYNDAKNYYSFKINQYYQQYTIGVIKDAKWIELVPWTRTVAINWKSINNIKVICDNGKQTFFINGVQVFQSTDNTLTSGGVGLSVQLSGKGKIGKWQFDNFQYEKIN